MSSSDRCGGQEVLGTSVRLPQCASPQCAFLSAPSSVCLSSMCLSSVRFPRLPLQCGGEGDGDGDEDAAAASDPGRRDSGVMLRNKLNFARHTLRYFVSGEEEEEEEGQKCPSGK